MSNEPINTAPESAEDAQPLNGWVQVRSNRRMRDLITAIRAATGWTVSNTIRMGLEALAREMNIRV